MKLNIAVLPGDGVGPEVTREAVRVLKAVSDFCGYDFKFEEAPIGGGAAVEFGSPFPQQTKERCLASSAVLLGAVGGPQFDSLPNERRPEAGLLALRQELGCFANLRPAVAMEAIADCSPLRPERILGANIMIVRELLGGLYFGEPRAIDAEGKNAWNTMRYSAQEIERVARVAFKLAEGRGKKLVSVDKANVLETSRLWRQVVTRVSAEFPEVALEHALVDSFAMNVITAPTRYDVVLTENLFGDILSDETAVIAGSLGLLPSASIGGKVDLYEPIHGSAPDIAGKGIANPIGAIASAAMMLRHTAKLHAEADSVELAIEQVLKSGMRTADLLPRAEKAGGNAGGRTVVGGNVAASTEEIGKRIAEYTVEALNTRMSYFAV
ncbi:MAG TPA: 3-isopropylmalate dehydrogenase [Candidatus Saccharimonadales bacterium]|nr:3-isopropylmalate dehydrogenase [Candidatus Saccharimonadales bacterium]